MKFMFDRPKIRPKGGRTQHKWIIKSDRCGLHGTQKRKTPIDKTMSASGIICYTLKSKVIITYYTSKSQELKEGIFMNKSELITKFDTECDKSPNNRVLRVICEHMIDFLHNHPQAAERIDEKKTLSGAIEEMKKEARKRAVNGCGVLTDEEGFEIIHKYFGIEAIEEQRQEKTASEATETGRKPKRKPVSLFEM